MKGELGGTFKTFFRITNSQNGVILIQDGVMLLKDEINHKYFTFEKRSSPPKKIERESIHVNAKNVRTQILISFVSKH